MNQQSGSLFTGFSGKAITSGRIFPLTRLCCIQTEVACCYLHLKKPYKLTRNALLDFCSSVIYLFIPALR